MNILQLLSTACPNISAQRVYAGIYTLNNDRFGVLRGISYEWLAVKLTELGFLTERRDRFSRRTVWERLKDLEKANLAKVKKNADGSLDVLIRAAKELKEALTDRYIRSDETSTTNFNEEQKRDNVQTNSNNNAIEETQNEGCEGSQFFEQRCSKTETGSQNGTPVFEEYTKENINNNTNKQINKPISLKTAVDQVDFTDPQVARFREAVARSAYEAGMHADLLDRAVAAVRLGYATSAELKNAIAVSKDATRQLEKTNGFKGKRYIWQTLTLIVKGWFDAQGYQWVPTSFRREPAPKPIVRFHNEEPDEDDVTVDEKGRVVLRRR